MDSLESLPYLPATLTALMAAGAGLATALAAARGGAAPTDDRADLAARKEALLAQIREIDDTRDKLDPPLYAAERARLVEEAAVTLAAIDALARRTPLATEGGAALRGDAAGVTTAEAPRGWAARHPQLSGALWGAGVVIFAGVLWYGLDQYSHPRHQMSGSPTSGGQGGQSGEGQLPPEIEAELAAYASAVAADPSDLEAKNRYGHMLIGVNKVMDAWKLADEVVEIDPGNAEARVHQAVMLMEMGDIPLATRLLDKVIADNTTMAEALGYRGALYAQAGDKAGAVAMWTRGRDADPAQAAVFSQLIARVDSLAGPSGGETSSGGADASPAGGESAEIPSGPVEFSGEVRLAEGVTATGGTLFVYVRPEGVDRGPPIRVKRMSATFPASFTITAADSPMGGALSGKVQITAKLDADGNPTTTGEGDLSAKSAPLDAGATGVVLTLGG